MLQGGRGAADRYHWRVWGALTVFRPHWVCPAHRCVLSPSTLLRLPAALYGAGPALRAVPVFGFSTKVQTWLGLRFVPSPAPAAQAARSLTGALSPGFGAPSPLVSVHLLPSAAISAHASGVRAPCVCSLEGAGLWPRPSRWMSTIQNLRKSLVRNWRPLCSLVGGAVFGAKFAPFPYPLPPASGGDGPVAAG